MYCVHKIFVRINVREITKPRASAVCSKKEEFHSILFLMARKKII
jgi:hypothetical protein